MTVGIALFCVVLNLPSATPPANNPVSQDTLHPGIGMLAPGPATAMATASGGNAAQSSWSAENREPHAPRRSVPRALLATSHGVRSMSRGNGRRPEMLIPIPTAGIRAQTTWLAKADDENAPGPRNAASEPSGPNAGGKKSGETSSGSTNRESIASGSRERKATGESSEADDLDAALLKDLDDELSGELMEDLEQLKPRTSRPGTPQKNGDGDSKSQPAELDPLEQRLEEQAESPERRHPLARIGEEMQRVEALIRQHQAGDQTRALQEKIVSELDRLIREAQQRSKSSSAQKQARQQGSRRDRVRQPNQQPAPGNAQGQQPAHDSESRLGQEKAAKADPKAVRKLMEELWGHLPERLRQQVINASDEEFLPKYELELEQYFRRLAEELRDAP